MRTSTSSHPVHPERKRGINAAPSVVIPRSEATRDLGGSSAEIPRRRLGMTTGGGDELLALRNIGPAMRRDFALLGIATVKQLARCRAERLYERLQDLTGRRQDPCVLDTFAAAIHQARTGEAL